MSKRLALLVCDTPIAAVVAAHGPYPDIFTALLRASLPAGADFALDAFDVVHAQAYPPPDAAYDAVLITGSAASAYENVEWINKLVAYVAALARDSLQTRIIGICFGHQIVARALGGECVPNGGKWEVGLSRVVLTDLGQELFGVPALSIQQMHRDHVPTAPPPLRLLGASPVAPNQGMVAFYDPPPLGVPPTAPENVHILTVQGHPEFTTDIVAKIVDARAATGVLTAEIAEDVRKRAVGQNDGISVVGRTIWRVLGVA